MPGRGLAIASLAVVVIAGLVFLLVSSRDSSPARAGAEAGPAAAGATPDSARSAVAASDPDRPRLPVTGAAEEDEQPRELRYREYVRADGVVVRDHRKGAEAPDLETALRTPRKQAKVKPDAILAARDVIRPKVHACAADHADAVGAGSRLQAQLAISIREGTMNVKEVRIQGELAQSGLADCVRGAVEDLAVPVEGHDDVSHQMLTFPFRLGGK